MIRQYVKYYPLKVIPTVLFFNKQLLKYRTWLGIYRLSTCSSHDAFTSVMGYMFLHHGNFIGRGYTGEIKMFYHIKQF